MAKEKVKVGEVLAVLKKKTGRDYRIDKDETGQVRLTLIRVFETPVTNFVTPAALLNYIYKEIL